MTDKPLKLGKFMTAERVPMNPHDVYVIHDRRGGALGTVEWYPRWREYVFEPEASTVFSLGCLTELARFVGNCNRVEQITRTDRA